MYRQIDGVSSVPSPTSNENSKNKKNSPNCFDTKFVEKSERKYNKKKKFYALSLLSHFGTPQFTSLQCTSIDLMD